MATFIETATGGRILVDPGVALAPDLGGMPPHPVERWMFEKSVERIKLYARIADLVIITTYEPGHFYEISPEIYRNKKILIKNPNSRIPASQRNRAFTFIQNGQKQKQYEIRYADTGRLEINDVAIQFSSSLFTDTQQTNTCVMFSIEEYDTVFLFSSCISGNIRQKGEAFIIDAMPDIMYLDGPDVTAGDSDGQAAVRACISNIARVIEKARISQLILDHHIKRSASWEDSITDIAAVAAARNIEIKSAAGMRGEEEQLLEARRRILYQYDAERQQRLF